MWNYILAVSLLLVVSVYIKHISKRKKSIKDKHVVITGGSSGIGKWVAIECAKRGAHITILARNSVKLVAAEKEIAKHCVSSEQKVQSISVDVTEPTLTDKILVRIDKEFKPIYMLVNCAGKAICGTVEDISLSDIRSLVDLNFLGTLHPIRSVVPLMKSRKEGILVLTSSQGGLLGIYGFSVYSATKFALRGLAEAIDMELRLYNVSVTVSLPPDTNTPGYENENKTKPIETALISESGGLYQPEMVAKKLVEDALIGKFYSSIGFESFLLTTACIGMSPFMSVFELLLQAILLGPLRIVSACILTSFYKVIYNCKRKKTN